MSDSEPDLAIQTPPHCNAPQRWHDGDTMLIFAALVALCGTLILLTALNPDNWVRLPDTRAALARAAAPVALGQACPQASSQLR